MISLITFLLFTSIITVEAAGSPADMTSCFQTYFKAWGLPDTPFPPNNQTFINKVDTFFNASKDNIDIICQRYSNFYQCVGGNTNGYTYDAFSTALSVDNTTAAFWVYLFFDQDYSCGSGLNGLKQMWGCNYDYSSCITNVTSCDDAINELNCLNKVINLECGKDAAVYECNAEIIELKYYSSCTTKTPDCNGFIEVGNMTKCLKSYFNAWGFSDAAFPPSPDDYSKVVDNFLLANVSNIDVACKREADFYKCVGSDNSTFNYDNFRQALGVNNDTAAFWVFAFFDQQYTCGDGLTGYKQGASCKFDLSSCKNGTSCDDQLNYYNCINQVLNGQCGTETAIYECNAEALDIKYNTKCTKAPDCGKFVNIGNMTSCFKNYFKAWGFPDTPFPPNNQTFTNIVDTFFNASKDNIDKICQRYSNFYQCVGGNTNGYTYDAFSTALSVDNTTAAFWLYIFFEQNYSCGSGLNGLKQTWGCNYDYSSCITNVTTCDDAINELNCMNKAINSQCGRDAAVYECNAERIELKYYSSCTINALDCDNFTSSGSIIGLGMTLILSVALYFLN